MDINITIVPFTVGVTSRRRSDNRLETTIWNRPETRTKAASVASPPPDSARMQNGTETEEEFEMVMQPTPIGPTRLVCKTVVTLLTNRVAKTIQAAWELLPPDACTTISGNNTRGVKPRQAVWRANPKETGKGGLS